MNLILTQADNWMDECERLTAAGEAFEVRDVHDIQVDFFKLLDDKYACSYILIGTTVKVTPRSG